MGGQNAIIALEQRVIHRNRFLLEYIQSRSRDQPLIQSARQICFTYHTSSGRVYKNSRSLHSAEHFVVHHINIGRQLRQMPVSLKGLGISPTEDQMREMAQKCVKYGPVGGMEPLGENDVYQILKLAL